MLKKVIFTVSVFIPAAILSAQAAAQTFPEGTALVESHGYSGCVQLSNSTTRVILDHHVGGRVLEYSLNGIQSLYTDPELDGWIPGGNRKGTPYAGRFDIGPEKIVPSRSVLWSGQWDSLH